MSITDNAGYATSQPQVARAVDVGSGAQIAPGPANVAELICEGQGRVDKIGRSGSDHFLPLDGLSAIPDCGHGPALQYLLLWRPWQSY
ncbi:hypothetical protein PMI04_007700 [Sphingobium sp. AP49]|uniref:hypothetical protein n=1 Tax=Sphingobium sp. AP49 TaxID=1144307 RepID=UPI0002D39986|nr:hypothetical protein [Sphingobium sp. AP49]WHO40469.1 hypothetical protein PMI04_007700 [Sphingobium sp. AP49]